MATTTVDVSNGLGVDHTGDAGVRAGPTLFGNSFNPLATSVNLGRLNAFVGEVDLFLRFDLSAIPLGSRIDKVTLRLTAAGNSTGTGGARVGFLVPDGVWEESGFARPEDTSGASYSLAYEYPNTGAAVPHATAANDDVLQPGIILDDDWAGEINWTPNSIVTNGWYFTGSGSGQNWQNDKMLVDFNRVRNHLDQPVVGLTLDTISQDPPTNYRALWFHSEVAINQDIYRPRFGVIWTENPPEFTSAFPAGPYRVGQTYVYEMTANPYQLGDQTGGNFLDLDWGNLGLPAGAAQVGNVITWTPTIEQSGGTAGFLPWVRNAGGIVAYQPFTVPVEEFTKGIVDGTPRAYATVGGSPNASPTVDGTPKAYGAAGGTPGARATVGGSPVIRSKVSGHVRWRTQRNQA